MLQLFPQCCNTTFSCSLFSLSSSLFSFLLSSHTAAKSGGGHHQIILHINDSLCRVELSAAKVMNCTVEIEKAAVRVLPLEPSV